MFFRHIYDFLLINRHNASKNMIAHFTAFGYSFKAERRRGMKSTITRIVRRAGIDYENKTYYHAALHPYQNAQVTVYMET